MTLNYGSYVNQLANLMVITSTDANFQTFLPGCIDYAEQRIYRELDVLNSRVTDTGTFPAGIRTFNLPTNFGTYVTVETINAISGTGNRTQMVPVTKEFLDAVFANPTVTTGTPLYFAPVTAQQYIIGPGPDQNYTAEVTGTQRPTALSVSNSSTFLTQYCPDLFMAASMVFATGFQRDFSAQSDDPRASASWESQYQGLFASANQEQLRARFEGAAWTPMTQAQVQPARV